jgi:hypothetical protein
MGVLGRNFPSNYELLDSGKFSGKVRFHEGFRLRTANKDGNCSSAYVRRVSGFFKTRILEELPTLQELGKRDISFFEKNRS